MSSTSLARLVSLLAVGAAAAAIVAFGRALFEAVPDPGAPVALRWLLLAVWTLVLPPVWGHRVARRLGRLAGRREPADPLRRALGGLWLEFTALGFGAAVAALTLVQVCR